MCQSTISMKRVWALFGKEVRTLLLHFTPVLMKHYKTLYVFSIFRGFPSHVFFSCLWNCLAEHQTRTKKIHQLPTGSVYYFTLYYRQPGWKTWKKLKSVMASSVKINDMLTAWRQWFCSSTFFQVCSLLKLLVALLTSSFPTSLCCSYYSWKYLSTAPVHRARCCWPQNCKGQWEHNVFTCLSYTKEYVNEYTIV